MDSIACNYHEDATTDDLLCIFPEDCDECTGEKDGTGTIINGDENNNGICDKDEKIDGYNFVSFSDCAIIAEMSQSEIDDYIKQFNTKLDTQIPIDICKIIIDYIMEMRRINKDYKTSTGKIDQMIENGWIHNTTSCTFNKEEIYQNILVERKKHFYWLNVRGGSKCDLGTIKFNPEEKGWQQVIVDSDPDDAKMKGYDMKIGGSGPDRIKVEGAMNRDFIKICY
jgi:hypothetical protein